MFKPKSAMGSPIGRALDEWVDWLVDEDDFLFGHRDSG